MKNVICNQSLATLRAEVKRRAAEPQVIKALSTDNVVEIASIILGESSDDTPSHPSHNKERS